MADATRRVSVRLSLDDAARVKAGLREVGETGQRSLDQIRGGAERASRSLELLDIATRGIQLAGVAVEARALVQAGDALTQGLSRLQAERERLDEYLSGRHRIRPDRHRCGNAMVSRHRAPASRLTRFLAGVPNTRAAAFRHSATEIGVEGLVAIATSTTTATAMADFCFNGLTGLAPTDRAVTLDADRGFGWVLDTSQAKEFAITHWLTGGAAGGRLFVRTFDGAANIRADVAGDVLASLTTVLWNGPAKGWSAGAPMDDANLNRRQTIRVGPGVAYAQIGVVGFDGPIDLQALRLYGLPEAAPAVLNGTPLLSGLLSGSGRREFAAEVSWGLPSLAAGATALLDVSVPGARVGDLASASLATSSRFIELDATAWSNNTVRVLARNVSNTTIDLAAATLSVEVTKRRVP